jgi:DNA-binding NarL/FixJ family response regulator
MALLSDPCSAPSALRSIATSRSPSQWSVVVAPPHASVFLVDQHSIFRLGMATCLEGMESVGSVCGVDSPGDAWTHRALGSADLVIVDAGEPEAAGFVRELRRRHRARVLAYGAASQAPAILAMVEAGAVGVLAKDSLTPDALEANVQAALQGACVLPPDLLGQLFAGAAADDGGTVRSAAALSQLTEREQDVLRLIGEGLGTREVAVELSYSERTVKSVLHDAVTKLGARSRSHAVAHAVRAGLI